MRKKIANKTYWQRGSGDIVGFLCTLPCIIPHKYHSNRKHKGKT